MSPAAAEKLIAALGVGPGAARTPFRPGVPSPVSPRQRQKRRSDRRWSGPERQDHKHVPDADPREDGDAEHGPARALRPAAASGRAGV